VKKGSIGSTTPSPPLSQARTKKTLHKSNQKCHHQVLFQSLKSIKCVCSQGLAQTLEEEFTSLFKHVAELMDSCFAEGKFKVPMFKVWLWA